MEIEDMGGQKEVSIKEKLFNGQIGMNGDWKTETVRVIYVFVLNLEVYTF
jgi:hypothetical protein